MVEEYKNRMPDNTVLIFIKQVEMELQHLMKKQKLIEAIWMILV